MKCIFRYLSWMPALCIGVSIGITSQYIPGIKNQSDKVFSRFEQSQNNQVVLKNTKNKKTVHFSKSLSGSPISYFQIQRPGYSLL